MQTTDNLANVVIEDDNDRQLTTYHETRIGGHLIRVTSVFLGKVELATALEDIAISKILKHGSIGIADSN